MGKRSKLLHGAFKRIVASWKEQAGLPGPQAADIADWQSRFKDAIGRDDPLALADSMRGSPIALMSLPVPRVDGAATPFALACLEGAFECAQLLAQLHVAADAMTELIADWEELAAHADVARDPAILVGAAVAMSAATSLAVSRRDRAALVFPLIIPKSVEGSRLVVGKYCAMQPWTSGARRGALKAALVATANDDAAAMSKAMRALLANPRVIERDGELLEVILRGAEATNLIKMCLACASGECLGQIFAALVGWAAEGAGKGGSAADFLALLSEELSQDDWLGWNQDFKAALDEALATFMLSEGPEAMAALRADSRIGSDVMDRIVQAGHLARAWVDSDELEAAVAIGPATASTGRAPTRTSIRL